MKKNYTLKLVLAMLVVVLISLVSFVGVYKGRNLLKEYSLGKDFSQRQVASYTVAPEENTESTENTENSENSENKENNENAENKENTENTENKENNENAENKENSENVENKEEKKEDDKAKDPKEIVKKYNKAKNIIQKRLEEMEIADYDIRLDEATGNLAIEAPSDIDVSYLSQVASNGSVRIMNQTKNETIADNSDLKSVTARLDKTSYTKPVVILTIKFNKNGKKKFANAQTVSKDDQGVESQDTFALTVDGQTIYSDEGTTFAQSGKNGILELVLGQNEDEKEVEKRYKDALALVAIMNNGELNVKYNIEGVDIVSTNTSVKSLIVVIIIVAVVLFLLMFAKHGTNSILPFISLIGLVALDLLTLRYTNVKMTLFTLLGLSVSVVSAYMVIFKALEGNKKYGESFSEVSKLFVPCIIAAIIFIFCPYIQLATLGLGFIWGYLVMAVYSAIITRTFINKE